VLLFLGKLRLELVHMQHSCICRYFITQLFKRGVSEVKANSVINRMYKFPRSSTCLMELLSFAYTGAISSVL
jgi:hypothetical protein